MRSNHILDVKNLQTSFTNGNKSVVAVKDVSFFLKKGETLGIVGESGSGKSMTALSLMRLVPPAGKIEQGEIIFYKDEKPVQLLSLSEKEMRTYRGKEMAMIFQEPMTSLNPVFTCGNQVQETIALHLNLRYSEAKEHAIAMFEKVQLQEPWRIFNSYPHQLSGGQKQRVMIAMAMSCNPSILIADEPTTALDITVQARILELMRQVRSERGMSMIFITHDLGVVAEVADRILVMYKGRIVEQGTVEEIFLNPTHPYTKGLLSCRPPVNKKLRKLSTINDFMREEPDGTLTEIRDAGIDTDSGNGISETAIQLRSKKLQEQPAILSVRELKVYFPTKSNIFGTPQNFIRAVENVSFEVYPGETLGLVGESGCGKTTLGRSILQLIRPDSGSVQFEGNELTALSNKALQPIRKHLQIIFQDPYSSLNPRMTVGAAIIEPMKVHKLYSTDAQRKEKVYDLLDKVNMHPDTYHRFAHELSGGQRQRVCIARALALNPKFIICDECVSALDVSVQAQVLNLLIQLREEFQFTYIFISHDLSVVKFMSDRMLVMNNGRIVESGNAEDVYNHPVSEFTKKLINAIPKARLIRN